MNDALDIHLNRYYHFTELMRDQSINVVVKRYHSEFDDTVQSELILTPCSGSPKALVLFFHGMDGDCGDGVVVKGIVKCSAQIVAPGGRGPCWLSDGFIYDSLKTIEKYSREFNSFYLMGISMGGTQVLSLATILKGNLLKKLAGVFAFIPGCDLLKLSKHSSNLRVKRTLLSSVNRNESRLIKRSPVNLVNRYKAGLPFCILYNKADTLLLSGEMSQFIDELRRRKHPVYIYREEGEHNFKYANLNYELIMKRIGQSSKREVRPPLLKDAKY